MKKFSVPCDFGGMTSPFSIYVGEPEPKHHPVHFQSDWLQKARGGIIPGEVMDSLSKLHELSKKNGASFEELCEYALGDNSMLKNNEDDDDALPTPPPAEDDMEAPMPME